MQHEDQQQTYLAERYRLIGEIKQFWKPGNDAMPEHVDLDALVKFILRRARALQEFCVLNLSRADVAMVFADDDDNEPDWPYTLADDQMKALASELQGYFTSEGDLFWDAIRDGCGRLALVGDTAETAHDQEARQ